MTGRLMNRDQVVTYVNTEVAYKPGWTIRAEAVEGTEGEIRFAVTFTAPNSDRDQARLGYPSESIVTPIPTHTMGMGSEMVNEDGVLTALLTWLVDIEIHEAREFLRVKSDDYAAPFHPHRWSGDARWEQSMPHWPTSFGHPTEGLDMEAEMERGLEKDAKDSRLAADLLASYREFRAREAERGPVIHDDMFGALPPELAELLRGRL